MKSSSSRPLADSSSALTKSVDISESRRRVDLEFAQSAVFGASTKTKSFLKATRSRDDGTDAGGSRPSR